MSVTILTQREQSDIVSKFLTGDYTKADLAREYNVSSRTIGRVLDAGLNDSAKAIDSNKGEEELDKFLNYGSTLSSYRQPDSYSYKFVYTPTVITISRKNAVDGKSQSETITSENEKFQEIVTILLTEGQTQHSLEKCYEIISISTTVENLTFGNITVDGKQGLLLYTYPGSNEQFAFDHELADRVITAAKNEDHKTLNSLIKFTERLAWNPNPKVINQLYMFLEASDIAIDDDGYVVCYKKIAEDYTDVYTRKIDNSVGARPKVKREYVDPNPNVTCSRGLHVCSWSYLKHYSGKIIVKCLVDPADFVAIPEEYYSHDDGYDVQAKARVCEYYVAQEIDLDEYKPEKQYETHKL